MPTTDELIASLEADVSPTSTDDLIASLEGGGPQQVERAPTPGVGARLLGATKRAVSFTSPRGVGPETAPEYTPETLRAMVRFLMQRKGFKTPAEALRYMEEQKKAKEAQEDVGYAGEVLSVVPKALTEVAGTLSGGLGKLTPSGKPLIPFITPQTAAEMFPRSKSAVARAIGDTLATAERIAELGLMPGKAVTLPARMALSGGKLGALSALHGAGPEQVLESVALGGLLPAIGKIPSPVTQAAVTAAAFTIPTALGGGSFDEQLQSVLMGVGLTLLGFTKDRKRITVKDNTSGMERDLTKPETLAVLKSMRDRQKALPYTPKAMQKALPLPTGRTEAGAIIGQPPLKPPSVPQAAKAALSTAKVPVTPAKVPPVATVAETRAEKSLRTALERAAAGEAKPAPFAKKPPAKVHIPLPAITPAVEAPVTLERWDVRGVTRPTHTKTVVADIIARIRKGIVRGQDIFDVSAYSQDASLPDDVRLFAKAAGIQLARKQAGRELLSPEKLEAVSGFPFTKYEQLLHGRRAEAPPAPTVEAAARKPKPAPLAKKPPEVAPAPAVAVPVKRKAVIVPHPSGVGFAVSVGENRWVSGGAGGFGGGDVGQWDTIEAALKGTSHLKATKWDIVVSPEARPAPLAKKPAEVPVPPEQAPGMLDIFSAAGKQKILGKPGITKYTKGAEVVYAYRDKEGRLAGALNVTRNPAGKGATRRITQDALVFDISVTPELQRQGIATKLLKQAETDGLNLRVALPNLALTAQGEKLIAAYFGASKPQAPPAPAVEAPKPAPFTPKPAPEIRKPTPTEVWEEGAERPGAAPPAMPGGPLRAAAREAAKSIPLKQAHNARVEELRRRAGRLARRGEAGEIFIPGSATARKLTLTAKSGGEAATRLGKKAWEEVIPLLSNIRRRIDASGGSLGKEVEGLLREALDKNMAYRGELHYRLHKGFTEAGGANIRQVYDILNALEQPGGAVARGAPKNVARAAGLLRRYVYGGPKVEPFKSGQAISNIAQRARELGLEGFKARGAYAPHSLSQEAINSFRDARGPLYNEALTLLVKRNIVKDTASGQTWMHNFYNEILRPGRETVLDRLETTGSTFQPKRSTTLPAPHLQQMRTFNWPEKFLETDKAKLMFRHADEAARTLAIAETFGGDQKGLLDMKHRLEAQMPKADARAIMSDILGILDPRLAERDRPSVLATVAGGARKASAVAVIDANVKTWWNNLLWGQKATWTRTDTVSLIRGVAKAITSKKYRLDVARHGGLEFTGTSYMRDDVQQGLYRRLGAGMRFVEEVPNRPGAAAAGEYFANKMLRILRKRPDAKSGKRALWQLKDLGLSDVDIKAAVGTGKFDWDMRGKIIRNVIKQSQFLATVEGLPRGATGEVGKLIMQYRAMAYRQTVEQLGYVARAAEQGRITRDPVMFKPLVRFVAGSTVHPFLKRLPLMVAAALAGRAAYDDDVDYKKFWENMATGIGEQLGVLQMGADVLLSDDPRELNWMVERILKPAAFRIPEQSMVAITAALKVAIAKAKGQPDKADEFAAEFYRAVERTLPPLKDIERVAGEETIKRTTQWRKSEVARRIRDAEAAGDADWAATLRQRWNENHPENPIGKPFKFSETGTMRRPGAGRPSRPERPSR